MMNHNNSYDFISSNIIRRAIIEEHEISNTIPKLILILKSLRSTSNRMFSLWLDMTSQETGSCVAVGLTIVARDRAAGNQFFFFHFKGGKVVQVDRTPLAKIQHPLDYQYPRALFNPYFALSLASLTPLSHFLYLSEMIQFSVSVCPSSSTEWVLLMILLLVFLTNVCSLGIAFNSTPSTIT